MLKTVILASTLMLAAPLAAAPLEVLPSGHPVAQVMLGGQGPFRFVIDTAASITAVLPALRSALPGSMRPAASGTLSGVSGTTSVETVLLDRLTADGRTYRTLQAVALPASSVDKLGVDGILGADVVAGYVLEMDMPGRRWTMTERPSAAMLKGTLPPVPFVLTVGKAPKLTVRVDGVDIPAILDTGAKGTMINWAAARRLGLRADSPGLQAADAVKGATAHGTASVSKTFSTVTIGGARFVNQTMRISDLPVFATLGMAEGPAMILGIDMLADRRFVIDHPAKQLHISPPKPTPRPF